MKLGVIGFGNMGSAIAKGFVSKKSMDIKDIGVFDTYDKTRERAKTDGFKVYNDETDLVKNSDTILVAVKPIHAKSLFEKIAAELNDKLIIFTVFLYSSKSFNFSIILGQDIHCSEI